MVGLWRCERRLAAAAAAAAAQHESMTAAWLANRNQVRTDEGRTDERTAYVAYVHVLLHVPVLPVGFLDLARSTGAPVRQRNYD